MIVGITRSACMERAEPTVFSCEEIYTRHSANSHWTTELSRKVDFTDVLHSSSVLGSIKNP